MQNIGRSAVGDLLASIYTDFSNKSFAEVTEISEKVQKNYPSLSKDAKNLFFTTLSKFLACSFEALHAPENQNTWDTFDQAISEIFNKKFDKLTTKHMPVSDDEKVVAAPSRPTTKEGNKKTKKLLQMVSQIESLSNKKLSVCPSLRPLFIVDPTKNSKILISGGMIYDTGSESLKALVDSNYKETTTGEISFPEYTCEGSSDAIVSFLKGDKDFPSKINFTNLLDLLDFSDTHSLKKLKDELGVFILKQCRIENFRELDEKELKDYLLKSLLPRIEEYQILDPSLKETVDVLSNINLCFKNEALTNEDLKQSEFLQKLINTYYCTTYPTWQNEEREEIFKKKIVPCFCTVNSKNFLQSMELYSSVMKRDFLPSLGHNFRFSHQTVFGGQYSYPFALESQYPFSLNFKEGKITFNNEDTSHLFQTARKLREYGLLSAFKSLAVEIPKSSFQMFRSNYETYKMHLKHQLEAIFSNFRDGEKKVTVNKLILRFKNSHDHQETYFARGYPYPFHQDVKGEVTPLDDEFVVAHYQIIQDYLESHGLPEIEIECVDAAEILDIAASQEIPSIS